MATTSYQAQTEQKKQAQQTVSYVDIHKLL